MVRISDIELIELLRQNARMPVLELARCLGVSEAAVRKRLKKLEEEGVIERYTVRVNPKKLGFKVEALIGLDTKPECYIPVIERLKQMRRVLSLATASGDHMILLECWCRDSEELVRFVRELEAVEGVIKVCPAVILERIK
jgi:Lrp/AsnC family transcriptional regulator for asnA, asnC and gidA